MTPFEQAARAHAESRGSKGTRALYLADLARWLVFCELEEIDPMQPTLEDANRFKAELETRVSPKTGKPIADITRRNTLLAVSSMYSNAIDAQGKPIVSWNPFKRVQLPPAVDHGLTEVVSKEAAEAVIQKTTESGIVGIRDHALLQLLYQTGIRVSTAVALHRSDLFYRGPQLFLRVTVKGGKKKEVSVPETAAVAVQGWLDCASGISRYVFPDRSGKKPLATKAVNKRINEYAKLAKVGKVHPHQFRAAFITNALDIGIPLHEVQAAVHHKDPKTTLRYDQNIRGAGVAAALAEFRKNGKQEPKEPK